jgi:hypothetical protein
VKSLLQTDKRF